jgi:hypothetical protein
MRCTASTVISVVFAACLVIASTVSLAVAQTGGNPFRKAEAAGSGNAARVPGAADPTPLSDQQLRLTEELRLLKRAESRMGEKHPAIQDVRKKIEAITEQLGDSAMFTPQAKNQAKNQAKPTQSQSIAAMNEQQLRQIIQRMIVKIEQLETRIETLERQRMVY